MTPRQLPLLLVVAALLSACGSHGDDTQVFGGSTDIVNHRITLHEGRVTIKTGGAPDAVVDAEGQLSIDGHDVPVNDAQRALLKRYNGAAQAMRADALATGKAGAATATQALSAAAAKVTGSDSAETARDKVETAARQVRQAAAKICDDLAEMKAAQDAVAAQLDAFKPYADGLDTTSVERCRERTSSH